MRGELIARVGQPRLNPTPSSLGGKIELCDRLKVKTPQFPIKLPEKGFDFSVTTAFIMLKGVGVTQDSESKK